MAGNMRINIIIIYYYQKQIRAEFMVKLWLSYEGKTMPKYAGVVFVFSKFLVIHTTLTSKVLDKYTLRHRKCFMQTTRRMYE